jgi:hypothetical protein
MDDYWMRAVENLTARVTGPLNLRLYLQPVMASILAVIAGLKDAKLGKPPFFWSLLTSPERRAEMVKDGWKSVGKVFVLAMILDIAFQLKTLGTVYPDGVLFVAFVLAIVPYLILRGLVTRLARRN